VAIVIRIPETFKPLADAMQSLLAEVERQTGELDRGLGAVDYADLERRVAAGAAAIEAGAHHALLSALAIEEREVLIDGVPHGRALRAETRYRTLAGKTAPLQRWLYRERGVRNGPTVDPIAVRAGVVADTWLPETACAMAYAVQQTTSREAEAQAARQHRLPYSRSSFEKVAHAVGELVVEQRVQLEATLIGQLAVPEEASSVSVSIDRVHVPMEEPKPRPAGRPKKGAPKRPVDRVWRQAYCGTLTLHDGEGRGLHTIRYARMPSGDPREMATRMATDVSCILRQRPELRVVALADGAPEMWNLLEGALVPELLGERDVTSLLDFWHVTEKLGAAAQLIDPQDGGKGLLSRWKMMLLNQWSAALRIARDLRASGKANVQVGDDRPVHNAITYLENNATRMRYRAAREAGLPIGSGIVEASCKTLVAVRMKRAGSRWKNETGDHILQLRALALSDRWQDAMTFTLRPLRRELRAA
jgi:hypothetical protein